MRYAVLTDSSSDLDPHRAEMQGIHVIPLNLHFDGHDWRDQQELRTAELFQRIQAGATLPTTSPPSQEQYRRQLDALLARHDHVLAVHLSRHLSDTVKVAVNAARDFPQRVTVVDSWNTTAALAMQAERAARLLNQGTPPEQVKGVLRQLRPQVRTRVCLDSLAYLARNGRASPSTALLGRLLNVKPLLTMQGGKLELLGRPHGSAQALRHLSARLAQDARELPPGRVSFFHNGNPEALKALQDSARRLRLPVVHTLKLGTVVSAHVGPCAYGYSYEPLLPAPQSDRGRLDEGLAGA